MTQESHKMLDDEAVSALLDGELNEFELRRLLDRLEERPDLLQRWERYNLAGAALQAEPLRRPGAGFSARIMEQIESSAELVTDMQPALSNRFAGSAARFAIAATVALAVFVGMQVQMQQDAGVPLADSQPDGSGAAQVAFDAEAQQRLNEYIRSVSIPARNDAQSAPFNVLQESPLLRPVSDRELISVGVSADEPDVLTDDSSSP